MSDVRFWPKADMPFMMTNVRFGRRADIIVDGRKVMTTNVKQMMEVANAAVPRITPAQAQEMMSKGNTLVVDVRDAPEVEKSGKAAGAVHVSRGMLEFRADPETPYHDRNFAKDKIVILYCASGGRSALSGKVLKDMGYREVYQSTEGHSYFASASCFSVKV